MPLIVWSPSLTMEAALAQEIVACIRADYPEATTGMTNAQVGKWWVKQMVRELLVRHRALAVADPTAAADDARRSAEAQRRAAEAQARSEADAIQE